MNFFKYILFALIFSLMVRPLDILATNNPTKGAQANHHPQ